MSFRFHLDIEAEVGNYTDLLSTPSLLITNPENQPTSNILYWNQTTKSVSYGPNIGPIQGDSLNDVLINGNTTSLTALFQDSLALPTITNTISHLGLSSNSNLNIDASGTIALSTTNDITLAGGQISLTTDDTSIIISANDNLALSSGNADISITSGTNISLTATTSSIDLTGNSIILNSTASPPNNIKINSFFN